MWEGKHSQALFWKSMLGNIYGSIAILNSLFLLYAKLGAIKNISKLSCKIFALTSSKALLKNEKRSGTSLPTLH